MDDIVNFIVIPIKIKLEKRFRLLDNFNDNKVKDYHHRYSDNPNDRNND